MDGYSGDTDGGKQNSTRSGPFHSRAPGFDLKFELRQCGRCLRGRITDALNTEVYRRFNEEEIEIPYLKQDVYIKEMPR